MTPRRRGALWGGRFESPPAPDMLDLTRSTEVDMRLLEYDLAVTRAHARVLAAAGLLGYEDVGSIDGACDAIAADRAAGVLDVRPEDEDVHTVVQRELTDRLGEVGARIHAGRSRNDLVATDLRLWAKDAAAACAQGTCSLVETLCALAEEHRDSVMPGFTHLQPAQPLSLGFHLMAHAFALLRDARRFVGAREAADVSALGAGALAGTTLPLEPRRGADELGFAAVFDNASDAVSDRDFACDLLYASALTGVHLSRLAEEVVVWASPAFGFVSLPDAWSTGSSMMPQKRNPDIAELVRGRGALGTGDLSSLLGVLKGMPLAYDRDLQEDKGLVFASVDRILGCLRAMTGLVQELTFNLEAMRDAAGRAATWATDLAETLVARGVPFRSAHEVVGGLVAELEQRGEASLTSGLLLAHHDAFEDTDVRFTDPGEGMGARKSPGGTAPERVDEQIARARALVSSIRAPLEAVPP